MLKIINKSSATNISNISTIRQGISRITTQSWIFKKANYSKNITTKIVRNSHPLNQTRFNVT